MSNRHKHESTHAADFFNSTIINNKTLMTTNYQNYVNDRLNLSVGGADLSYTFSYIIYKIGQFRDEDDITGVKFIDQDFYQFNKKSYEMKLYLDSAKMY